MVKVAFGLLLGFSDSCSSATGDGRLALNDKTDKFLLVDDPLVSQQREKIKYRLEIASLWQGGADPPTLVRGSHPQRRSESESG